MNLSEKLKPVPPWNSAILTKQRAHPTEQKVRNLSEQENGVNNAGFATYVHVQSLMPAHGRNIGFFDEHYDWATVIVKGVLLGLLRIALHEIKNVNSLYVIGFCNLHVQVHAIVSLQLTNILTV